MPTPWTAETLWPAQGEQIVAAHDLLARKDETRHSTLVSAESGTKPYTTCGVTWSKVDTQLSELDVRPHIEYTTVSPEHNQIKNVG